MKHIPFCEKVIRNTIEVEYEEPGLHEFRTSSLPYCPIHDFQEIMIDSNNQLSYRMNFFTGIGTAVHENIQNMSGMSKFGPYVFGSWKCPKCGHIHEVCFRPKKCKECGERYLEYVELAFNYKGLSGHQDMLACYPCDDDGNFVNLGSKVKKFLKELQVNHNSKKYQHRWCSFEYKTTGTKYIKDFRYMKYLPTPKHFGQVEAYCVMLDLLYDIKVSEYCIIYFSRENVGTQEDLYFKPFVYEWTEEKYNYRLMTIERACKSRELVEKAIKYKDDSKKLNKYLEKIIDNRPCKHKKDWELYMQKKYFADEKCPYLKLCLNGDISCKKILKDIE